MGRVFEEDELRYARRSTLTLALSSATGPLRHHHAPHRHLHIANLDERFAATCITFMAPSKTFNLAGLSTAYAVIPNKEDTRKKYLHVLEHQLHIGLGNIAGIVGLEAAYNNGGDWLNQLIAYVQGNVSRLDELIKGKAAQGYLLQARGTYLAWLDFRLVWPR